MERIAAWVSLSWGWKRRGIAFAAGAFSVLGFPPFSFPLILVLTMPILVWLLDGALDAAADSARVKTFRPAFGVGLWFGLGFFGVGLHWIGEAFLVDASLHGWIMPVAVFAMAGGMAVFYGLACGFARMLWSPGIGRLFALATMFGLFEWLRGHVLTGFPWNTFGYALTVHDIPLQAASIFGVYGLTILAVFIFTSPAALIDTRFRFVPVILAVVSLSGLTAYGVIRLEDRAEERVSEGIDVRIVQANIPQAEKWRGDKRASIFSKYLDLTTDPPASGGRVPKIVIWPESAPPFLLAQDPGGLSAIAAALRPDQILITGANRAEDVPTAGPPSIFNSLYLIDGFGDILDRYDKMRLVPFGETLPFGTLLHELGLGTLVALPGTFQAGRRAFNLEGLGVPPFRPLICYEIIFSGDVISPSDRPRWIVNATNDAWFGSSIGPHQHFHKARVRAVEEGIPIARAANTGISAMIDGYGTVIDSIGLDKEGYIDIFLPNTLPMTIFSRYGDILFWILFGTAAGGAVLTSLATRSERQKRSRR